VKRHASQIAAVTGRRYMPPWLPQSGYGEFSDERRLSPGQIRLIQEWVAQGAPEGRSRSVNPVPKFTSDWQLGQPDLIVKPSKQFMVPEAGPDVFWNFVLTPNVRATKYVRALEIRPQNPRLVHHANLLLDRARTTRFQEKRPGEGFPGMDLSISSDSFDPDSHFLFWKAGTRPYEEPKGMAWRLDPGDDLVLNVHLQPSGKREEELPSIGLYFTDEAQTVFPMLIQLEHDRALDIPAGDADFQVTDSLRLPMDVDLLAVYPHAHFLGKLLEGYATLPDGKRRWLIRIPDWDINWQGVFRYTKPIFLPAGSIISMRYHYDNSTGNPRNPNVPPKRVRGGNQATDEMGHLWLQVLPHGQGDPRLTLQEALMRHRLEEYPDDFGASFNLGSLLFARKDLDHAIPYLRASVRLEPKQIVALNTLGAALESEKQLDEAVTLFNRALGLRSDYTDARFNLANALGMQGKLLDAALQFRTVVAENPADQAAKNLLSQVLQALGEASVSGGNVDQAIAYYVEVVQIEPKNADLRNLLGLLYARSGKDELAMEQFQEALKIDALHQDAQKNLRLMRAHQHH
jgi:tetratricopeptide (TPR) repeat protein